jgi:hypothetical protein
MKVLAVVIEGASVEAAWPLEVLSTQYYVAWTTVREFARAALRVSVRNCFLRHLFLHRFEQRFA